MRGISVIMRGQSAVADEACHRSAATSAGPVRASYGSKSALPAAEIPALVDPTGGHNGPRSGRSASVAGQSDGFRPEIEGLRAVAAFLVAIYHIWIGRVSGGVDVFFVVSGFLITTTLIPLVVYQTILTILGLRGRENGPASERHAWLENAAVTALCLGLVAAVWSF